MSERAAFGTELRRARERRGLTLEAIAEQTKVSAGHFAGLERADLSRWPSGIFRRAFVRSYAVAVGLDPEETVARFTRLFADPAEEQAAPNTSATVRAERTAEPGAGAAKVADEGAEPRQALEHGRASQGPALPLAARRLLAGVLDISMAIMPASLVALAAGVNWFWPVVACVAMAGHLACYASLGTTPGAWLIARLTAPPVVVQPPPVERRRAEAEVPPAPRRRVARPASSRPGHVHRVRH
jgi:transcriptional regulator with XRE-family HTH domain